MHAVGIKTVVVAHVVHDCPNEGSLIIAAPEIASVEVPVLASSFFAIIDVTRVHNGALGRMIFRERSWELAWRS